jgi:proteasome accessory factor B
MAVPVSNEERLFSLVLALLATETGLTKTDVLSSVQGYRQRYRLGGDNASLERQFERDKDDVRDLGVPLETIEFAGDPSGQRYRIPKGSYDLPDDVTFTPQEIALLNLAGLVWREGSLSGDSRRALIKLRSKGIESNEPLLGYAPRLSVREAAFAPLQQAIERGTVVTFSYLKPGEPKSRNRQVAPYALVQYAGRWHVYARDESSGGMRTFLLSRIVSPVARTAKHFDLPAGDHAAEGMAGLVAVAEANVAVVRAVPGTDAATRLSKRAVPRDDGTLALNFTDLAVLADDLAAFGPEVLVLEPADLVAAVRKRLLQTQAAHSGALQSEPVRAAPAPRRRKRVANG